MYQSSTGVDVKDVFLPSKLVGLFFKITKKIYKFTNKANFADVDGY